MAFEVPQPMQYSQGENLGLTIGQGLGALGQGLGAIRQQEQEQQAKQQLQQFQSAFGQAYASGDRDAMKQLVAQYPGQFEQVQKGLTILNAENKENVGTTAADLRLAAATGNKDAILQAAEKNRATLEGLGATPESVVASFEQDPQQASQFLDMIGLHALGPDKYFDVMDKKSQRDIQREGLDVQRRGQDITVRGQDISASTARRGQDMANQRAGSRAGAEQGNRVVQLADGRTVNVGGKLHGAGANAFYEGIDNAGNMVRVPASAIAAPATSAASAQNYAMKKDLDAILNTPSEKLGFMTGLTGGNGSPSWDAEVRSRLGSGDQRQLFNATKRIQGKMQNQGVAAARDMGASGINTVTEAKMYFQGMPQVDYSSPEAMQQSLRDIQQYTDQYNQQYSVDVGSSVTKPQSSPAQQSADFSSLWGG